MKPFLKWQRNEHSSREFYFDTTLPPTELTTAAIGIVKYGEHFIFTENHRGIEIPGWHIEPWETIEHALQREIAEETGAIIHKDYILVWYTKVYNKVKRPRRDGNWYYPFPYAYMAHFLTTAQELIQPHGEETIARHIIHKNDIETVWLHDTAYAIIQEVLKNHS